ncbi:hypothetical protein KV112_21875 [Mycolicibacter sp. MYC123]|uniref:Uncharacterized protein n=1 Tax=[Mycobacterium] zoologicum TaxID=2872311 RepID=A0ABU5YRG2_9MYCO|nr:MULTISPECIES: hypothetical protein [unclassified Mycolicibacter]MEB3052345.1 hypothetical protein [Mycolicibacter sp. MYC123]MEB3062224.1 hypothetical protein [Mycolicibacter sp. MYC101]
MAGRFNPPPGWPVPQGWSPPAGWEPDPTWPPAPAGWQFWTNDATPSVEQNPPPFVEGSPVHRSSRWLRWGIPAAIAVLVVGAAGGLFGWLRYQNEQALVSSLTTIKVQGTEFTGIDDVTTAPDGTLYVLTGAGGNRDPDVLKVNPATGASQALRIPRAAFPSTLGYFARPLAVGPDGSVFTGSHLWNPSTGTVQEVTSEDVDHAAIDAHGQLAYSVSVEDKGNNYRATTTVYRTSAGGQPYVLATIPGSANGLAIDSNSQVLVHTDATIGWHEGAKVLRASDGGGLETLQIDDIQSSSGIAVDDAGRLVYACADRHAICSRQLGANSSARLEFTTVRPMWTNAEAGQLGGGDAITWLPEGKALAVTYVRGKKVIVVAQPPNTADSRAGQETGVRQTFPSTAPPVVPAVLPPGAVECGVSAGGAYRGAAKGTDSTSCPFVENVRDAFNNSGGQVPSVVEAYSPVTGKHYQMSCAMEQVITCRGGVNAVVYVYEKDTTPIASTGAAPASIDPLLFTPLGGHGRAMNLQPDGTGTLEFSSGASNSDKWNVRWTQQADGLFEIKVVSQISEYGDGTGTHVGSQWLARFQQERGFTVLRMVKPGESFDDPADPGFSMCTAEAKLQSVCGA